MSIDWSSENKACLSTYRILVSDDRMDEFEEDDYDFLAAENLTVGKFRFKIGVESKFENTSAREAARVFLDYLNRFNIKKKDTSRSTKDFVNALYENFKDENTRVKDIAETVDQFCIFPG